MANYHVTNPEGSRQWKVIRERAKRASAVVGTQAAAEKLAKRLASRSGGGEVRVHYPHGGPIRDSDTVAPARDPYPPRDRKH